MSATSHHTLDEGLWYSCWELIEGGGWQCSSANGGACKGDQHVWPAVAQFEALSVISSIKLYAFLDYFYQSECREINVVCMDQTLKDPILHHHRFRAVSNNLILHSSCLKSFCCCIICFSFLSFSNWNALTRAYIWCESCPKNACWSWCGGQIRWQKNTLHVSHHNLLVLFTFPVFELSLIKYIRSHHVWLFKTQIAYILTSKASVPKQFPKYAQVISRLWPNIRTECWKLHLQITRKAVHMDGSDCWHKTSLTSLPFSTFKLKSV